ncbi:MAG: radical SAM protein [Gammaproteobacteria bacterium RBG_16_51_14]|nr:MAG: radical SAM protein [Gammaproteobacteria bacterium RBG_16_51_14]
MHETLPYLRQSDFPLIRRKQLQTLQVNITLKCNQQCVHCHVNASPRRTEAMDVDTIELVLEFLRITHVQALDITGGAPELHPHFRYLVTKARSMEVKVIDRCNLTVLEEPDQTGLAAFLAGKNVEIIASLPCYLEENVDRQRGKGVFAASVRALRKLNELGYGIAGSGLVVNLVYNPQGPALPPDQGELEQAYRQELRDRYRVEFNHLFTFCNMPIKRFGSTLISTGQFNSYMSLLREVHRDENLDEVMCRSLISVDWRGYVYDCDFNQMLGLDMTLDGKSRAHLSALLYQDISGKPITVCDHCYGCTAGQGSSCGGALAI